MLVQYIRNQKNEPIGCMVAVQQEDGRITIGVSLHNPKDKWDRSLARQIAIGRAYCDGVMPYVPSSKARYVAEGMRMMINRASRYFKEGQLSFYTGA
jgi:hypothetical protein